MLNRRVFDVTERLIARSKPARDADLAPIAAAGSHPHRKALGCANQAPGFAGRTPGDTAMLREGESGVPA